MHQASLSLRLGLGVTLMGAALVLLLACLAVFALEHELDSRARKDLARKMLQVEHNLRVDLRSEDLGSRAHPLLDLVMGHDNLSLSVLSLDGRHPQLLSLGPALKSQVGELSTDARLGFHEWRDSTGQQMLTATRQMRLRDDTPVRVMMSLNRADDNDLLQAYLHSTLLALPLLLMLIGAGAWWLMQRGLRPLRHFRRIAGRVSAQDLQHRLPAQGLPLELAELATGINVMLDRLDQGVRQLSEFSDDLAHELRTPLSNLMGKAQVTLARERDSENYREVLADSIEELTRLNRIINDMLFLAQVSQPQAQLALKPLALADEAQQVLELFAFSAEHKRLTLQLKGWGTALADRLMFQRALSNLLSNAIRHSPAGREVNLGIERRGDEVWLWVANEGPGITDEHLPRLFERFYRAGSGRSRLEGGTGLGLAIVKSIMELHVGRVEVNSSPTGPTRFSLVFRAE
ncbi:heavy metal sensor histidine kinase [Pseudomonas plecoglossicida]|uniref:Sensor protein n=1 Tax=Pseudomonas plecoglossicida TaxID=70775 RepID=A0AAD0QWB2_PSEDL|nr:heavy metal sensor histidine kinase [Pseudomonas plecoglossicida]AXM96202.1 HAMP domain-containing protein [Pseudomonas plecoglossicida]EPB93373.1 heavy metal sensor signal transduction histidine kinase [Pseudomonas plecoglossicida NB2011]QLB56960.1 heavy metal sensor histidine kinase [Pseudomonas plecoglossicida]